MVKAQQIEKDGTPFGPVREFPDPQWRQMRSTYGKRLRWIEIENNEQPVQEVIYPKEDLRKKLGEMTKKMIISEYNLPEEDKKLNREELINKVVKLQ
jgi:hypothetical protein